MDGAAATRDIAHEITSAPIRRVWSRFVSWVVGEPWSVTASRRMAVVLGLTIPLSTTATEVVLVALLIFWLMSGDYAAKLRAIRGNRVVVLSLALFAVFAIAFTYSTASWAEAAAALWKYRKLLYVAVFATVLADAPTRDRGILAFQIAMLVTLAGSFLMRLGLLTSEFGNASDCAIFKNHIAQNSLMVFFVAVSGYQASRRGRFCWLHAAAALLGAYNVLFMVAGRTGHIILLALVCLLMFQWKGLRGLAYGAALAACLALAAYDFSDTFGRRMDEAIGEAYAYYHFGTDGLGSSIGRRLAFYRSSLAIATRHPVFGTGTGSFATEFSKLPRNLGDPASTTPHSGYFGVLVQTGGLGLGLFLFWLYTQWTSCRRLPPEMVLLAQALVVTFVVGNLVNSLLSSTTEGWLYCYFAALCFAGVAQATPDRDVAESSQVPLPETSPT